MDNVSKELSDFLKSTDPFMEQIDDLSIETAAELYDLLDDAAKIATGSINDIDTELRVETCNRQDMILERIVDELPPFEHSGDPLKIYSPAIQGYRRWENVELMKDCGLVGYMLAKQIKATPIMLFCTKPGDYPYLSELPQMEMIFDDSEPGSADTYYNHLKTSYSDMDVMLFYGMYSHSVDYLHTYRSFRPDGKVYCGLDMNSYWMDTTPWDSAEARRFADQCDIIATSCRSMRNALNRNPKVHFPCRWFTNGFYKPTGIQVTADPDLKANIILTVGRIGTFQKNNEELLTAFADVSGTLKNWSLRFVGSIEPDFQKYIDDYYLKHPYLKDRVIFTGSITDKAELYSEYSKATVFALSSRLEGFPNVYSEALFHGCMFITSDVDAADDITNYGQLGLTYKIGDVDALKKALIETCAKADRNGIREHIPKALEYARRYYDWNRNAKKLAYMLFN